MPASAKLAETVELDKVELSPEQQKEELEAALERLDKLAESELEMVRLFLERGKIEIAKRRLEGILESYPKSHATKEARKLLSDI